jgi:hypothetical protein
VPQGAENPQRIGGFLRMEEYWHGLNVDQWQAMATAA